MDYSDDGLSLAQEIAGTLKKKGFWVHEDWAGPDLIMAVGLAIEQAQSETLDEIQMIKFYEFRKRNPEKPIIEIWKEIFGSPAYARRLQL
jgi:hypothetical protein